MGNVSKPKHLHGPPMTHGNNQYRSPSREDYFDYLVRCYFPKSADDLLELCVRRAYLDLSRTLHGFAKLKNREDLRERAHQYVVELLRELPTKTILFQPDFDQWHQAACTRLKNLYRKHGFNKFSVGQAQKWLNMSMKYVFTLGEARLPGFASLFQFAHAPIDKDFLERVELKLDIPRPCVSWSRWDNYAAYLKYQKEIRDRCPGSVPLAVEFWLWLDNSSVENEP
jgi:hypothetical protein